MVITVGSNPTASTNFKEKTMDRSITERLLVQLGTKGIVSIGIGANDTIIVFTDAEFTGNVPTTFEGYRVVTEFGTKVEPL